MFSVGGCSSRLIWGVPKISDPQVTKGFNTKMIKHDLTCSNFGWFGVPPVWETSISGHGKAAGSPSSWDRRHAEMRRMDETSPDFRSLTCSLGQPFFGRPFTIFHPISSGTLGQKWSNAISARHLPARTAAGRSPPAPSKSSDSQGHQKFIEGLDALWKIHEHLSNLKGMIFEYPNFQDTSVFCRTWWSNDPKRRDHRQGPMLMAEEPGTQSTKKAVERR